MQKNKKIIIVSSIIAGVLLTTTGYFANRYLFDHIEIENAIATSSSSPASKTTSITTNSSKSNTQNNNVSLNTKSSDMTYVSSSKNITVGKVETGSGNNKVTYYVADVTVNNASNICSAFAKNQFGSNITQYTSEIAQQNNAVFAINGDYYGFRDDGIVIHQGNIYRDIPARTGLAFYSDGSMKIYDETATSAQELIDNGVINTFSFGPALLIDGNITENIGSIEIDTNFGNHSIQGNQPRTGVGVIDNNHFIFIVVDGRSQGYSVGVTLEKFAQIFKSYGCTDAYNLDGGGSSTMYFNGEVINNPQGKNRERGVSDIIYIPAD